MTRLNFRPAGSRAPRRQFGLLLFVSLCAGLAACQSKLPVPATAAIGAGTPTPDTVTVIPTNPPTITATAIPSATATASVTPTAHTTPTALATALTSVVLSSAPPGVTVIALADGPHLFIDDYLIAYRDKVTRQVATPDRTRLSPLITGLATPNGDANADFSAVVLRDPSTGQFRMWHTGYDLATHQIFGAYSESDDGLHWIRPFREVSGTRNAPIIDVIDLGPNYPDAAERYRAITTSVVAPVWLPKVLTSPDGLNWKPASVNLAVPVAYGEVWRIFTGLAGGGFGVLHRWDKPYSWTDAAGTRHDNTKQDPGFTRLFAFSTSPNLQQIQNTQVIFAPGPHDSGETEFYSMSNVIRRGDYYLAMLDVLRDDVRAPGVPTSIASPTTGGPVPVYGVGYTVLAWSRDGRNWSRDDEKDPYFLMSPDANAWDHAVAWIDSLIEVGNSVYMYYGGYHYGHKVGFDRQIGMVTTIRDRYVAQAAGPTPGTLRTPLVTFQAATLTLNADVKDGGWVSLQVLDSQERPVPGFGPGQCAPLTLNSLDLPVACQGSFASLAGQPVFLQFEMENADLFAFSLQAASSTP